MVDEVTRVEIAFYPEHFNDWLRFGTPDHVYFLDRRRSLALFAADRTFGYVRWRAGDYGTARWRFVVARTGDRTRLERLEGVDPGAEILLAVSGATLVPRALAQIDRLEKDGFDPADVSPRYYRHLQNRLATGKPPQPYSADQHAAWCAAQKLLS